MNVLKKRKKTRKKPNFFESLDLSKHSENVSFNIQANDISVLFFLYKNHAVDFNEIRKDQCIDFKSAFETRWACQGLTLIQESILVKCRYKGKMVQLHIASKFELSLFHII